MNIIFKPNNNIPIKINENEFIFKKDKQYLVNYYFIESILQFGNVISFDQKQYNINIDLSNKSVLFVRSFGLGDILFLTPVLKIIKEKYPNCKIGFATVKYQHELLSMIKEVDEIIEYPIDLDIIKNYVFHFFVSGLVENKLSENQDENIYKIYLKHLGLKDEEITEDLLRPYLTNLKIPEVDHNTNIIGIHPFSGNPVRQLNLNLVSLLCKKLIDKNYKINLFSNTIEYNEYKYIFDDNRIKWVIENGNYFSNTITNLLKCKTVISTDSFITHLCQVLNVNCICIYGPFPAISRVSGYKNITIIDSNPDCRCYLHSKTKCLKKRTSSPCLNIDTDLLVKIIENKDDDYEFDKIKIYDPIISKFNFTNLENGDEQNEKEK